MESWDMEGTLSQSGHRLSDPATWVDQYGDYLFRNAMLRLRDKDLAEDAVQETFLAALDARSRFSGRSAERTWLVGILKHKVVDALRKFSREQSVEDINHLSCEEEHPFLGEGEWRGHWRTGEGLALAPSDWGANPSWALEQKEFWKVFNGCLSQLPSRLARAFALREVDGLDSKEVCKVLDITSTNLWVMLHRCRMQLRRCIETRWMTPSEEGD